MTDLVTWESKGERDGKAQKSNYYSDEMSEVQTNLPRMGKSKLFTALVGFNLFLYKLHQYFYPLFLSFTRCALKLLLKHPLIGFCKFPTDFPKLSFLTSFHLSSFLSGHNWRWLIHFHSVLRDRLNIKETRIESIPRSSIGLARYICSSYFKKY